MLAAVVVPVNLQRNQRLVNGSLELGSASGTEHHMAVAHRIVERKNIRMPIHHDGEPSNNMGLEQVPAFGLFQLVNARVLRMVHTLEATGIYVGTAERDLAVAGREGWKTGSAGKWDNGAVSIPNNAPLAAPNPPAEPAARSYEAVLESIEDELKAGRIKVGDQLPGERALALKHGISRASVRDAIRVLDAMGVVRTAAGSGPRSGAVVIANPSAGLASTLRLHMATNHFPVADIVQTRIMMETWAAGEAAIQPRDHDQETALGSLLTAMADPQLDREEFHVLDAAFHVQLSALAGNAVITAMMESLRSAIQGYVSAAIDSDERWARIVPTLRAQHDRIFAAVLEHDGARAAQELRGHIEWFHEQTRPLR